MFKSGVTVVLSNNQMARGIPSLDWNGLVLMKLYKLAWEIEKEMETKD